MQWADVVSDATLKDLPYKIELNGYGQIVMTPHCPIHWETQSILQEELSRRLTVGVRFRRTRFRHRPGFGLQMSFGTRTTAGAPFARPVTAGVAPAPIAPEICVEAQSRSNSDEEMAEKRALHFEAGELEFWLCNESGELRFFDPAGEHTRSELVPSFPVCIKV
jgi:hypothetical protein